MSKGSLVAGAFAIVVFLQGCSTTMKPRQNIAGYVYGIDVTTLSCKSLDSHLSISYNATSTFNVVLKHDRGRYAKYKKSRIFWIEKHNEQLKEYKRRCKGIPNDLKKSGKKRLMEPLPLPKAI